MIEDAKEALANGDELAREARFLGIFTLLKLDTELVGHAKEPQVDGVFPADRVLMVGVLAVGVALSEATRFLGLTPKETECKTTKFISKFP